MVSNTKKAGVIGFPVSHSLSPRLHGYWLKKYNIDGEYQAYPVEPKNLASFIKNLRTDKNFVGANFTIPHKEEMMKLVDETHGFAWMIEAVNTIIVKDGQLHGINTDDEGFMENIRTSITGKKKAVVLGAGGAAKAVIFALKILGFEQIIVTNRTRERAEKVAQWVEPNLEIADWENRSEILENTDLLVNTTSLGMTGKEHLEIDLSLLPKTALVTDIVYSPLITGLLTQAQARGNTTVDGLGMLLYQAVPAFEAWFGVRPEVTEELRQYVLNGG